VLLEGIVHTIQTFLQEGFLSRVYFRPDESQTECFIPRSACPVEAGLRGEVSTVAWAAHFPPHHRCSAGRICFFLVMEEESQDDLDHVRTKQR